MSEPVVLITNEVIEPSVFRAFLQQAGATLDPDNVFDGRISANDKHVWIAFHQDAPKEWEVSNYEVIKQRLGGEPKSNATLEISRTEGSEQLAIDFACAFAKRWTCVIDDLQERIYSAQELFEMQCEGRGFSQAYIAEHAIGF